MSLVTILPFQNLSKETFLFLVWNLNSQMSFQSIDVIWEPLFSSHFHFFDLIDV